MAAIYDAIVYLYPNSIPQDDWQIAQEGQDIVIVKWNPALGSQPTQAQLDAVTQSQIDAAKAAKYRNAAKATLAAVKAESATLRAFMLLMLDELNAHTAKINSILTAVDNAATFATLKTAILAIADLPTRTANQLRTAINNKLDAGDGDT